MVVIVKIGIYLYSVDMATIGQITSFLFYMLMLLWNFQLTAWAIGSFYSVLGASDKLVEIIKAETLMSTTGGEKLEGEMRGRLSLKNIKFSYPS